jgi:hypothetical protein
MTLSPSHIRSGRPLPGEFAAYALADIEQVSGDDALVALASQAERVLALLATVNDDAVEGVTYAPTSGRSKTWSPTSLTTSVCSATGCFVSRARPGCWMGSTKTVRNRSFRDPTVVGLTPHGLRGRA